VEVWQTSNLRLLRLGEEKKEEERKKKTRQKYNGLPWATITKMWANANHDGRPAEYRWRPLFNAAKFG